MHLKIKTQEANVANTHINNQPFLYYFTEIKAILIKKVHLKNFKYYASVVDINLEDVIHP